MAADPLLQITPPQNASVWPLSEVYYQEEKPFMVVTNLSSLLWVLNTTSLVTASAPADPLQQTQVMEPWEMLGLDFMGPLPSIALGNTQVLPVVNFYGQWVELLPLQNATMLVPSKGCLFTLGRPNVCPITPWTSVHV